MTTLHMFSCGLIAALVSSNKRIVRTFKLVLFLVAMSSSAIAQISGIVYRDFNEDGVRSYTTTTPLAGEIGVGGVTVNVYNGTALVASTTTSTTSGSATGTYSFPSLSSGSYRVEFVNLPTGYFEGARGAGSATSVQFVTAPNTAVNLGINYPADYCQAIPYFVVPCYVNGNSTGNGTASTRDVLVTLPYNSTGQSPSITDLALNNQIGTVYGVAYQRQALGAPASILKGKVFTSAFVKRHSGLGPGGAGAIYLSRFTSTTTVTTSLFASLSSTAGTVLPNAAGPGTRDLPADAGTINRDPSTFDQVGKAGLGDLEISEDGTKLYVVNLADRKLYEININNPTGLTPTAGATASYVIPNPASPTCPANSVFRPFGLKYYRDKVYVGGVCTNENVTTTKVYSNTAGTNSLTLPSNDGMQGVVFEFNPNTSGFTQVLAFPLTYRKGASNADKSGVDRADFWYPWISSQPATLVRNDGAQSYPQPILAGIEFDVNGDMIIGIRDRFGDQYGNQNYGPNSGDTKQYNAIAPGDILRASKCNAAVNQWTIENNAGVCSNTAVAGVGNGEGPGGGEYYSGDRVAVGANHAESSEGGLALFPGRDEVASIALDPTDIFNTGGIRRYINSTGGGTSAQGVQIFSAENVASFGKANGLGDLEIGCDLPPVQIGNRVWRDYNNNGVQDAGEPGLAGVQVILKGPGSTTIATATTDANGEYYFSTAAGTSTTSSIYNLTALTAGSSYTLSFPTATNSLFLSTLPNSATGTNADAIDSDANNAGNIVITLGDVGENNFTFDVGYTCPTLTNPSGSQSICSTASVSSLSVATNATGTNAIQFVYFTSPQSGTAAYTGGTSLSLVTPVSGVATISNVSFPANNGQSPVTYYVYALFNTATAAPECRPVQEIQVTVKPIPNGSATGGVFTCIAPATVSATSSLTGTNTYSWTGPNNFVSSAQSFTTTTAGTYTVTVSNNGCTDPTAATAVVTANTTPPQNVSATNDGPLTCADPVANVSVTTSTTGTITYRWTGPNNFTANTQSFTANTAGIYSVTLTSSTNGCTSTVSTTVTSSTAVPSISLGNDGPLTCTETSATISATVSGFGSSYSYRFNGGALVSNQTSSTLSFPVTAAGSYALSITASNGCTTASSTTVTSNTVAPGASVNSLTLTCANPSGTLTASVTNGVNPTYLWSTGANTPSISVNAAGPYSVTVTNANGCFSTASTTVQSNTVVPGVTVNSLTLTCGITSGVLTATATNVPNPAYLWNTGATTPFISVSASGTYSVTVTNPANGCSNAASTTVQSNTTVPTISINNSGPLTCATPSTTVSATVSGFGTGYSYRFNNGAVVSNQTSTTLSFPVTTSGNYILSVTANNGCSNTASTTITANAALPGASISSLTLTCANPTGILSVSTSIGNATYTWSKDGLSTPITSATATVNATGVYSVTVVNPSTGCSSVVSTTVISNTAVPSVTMSNDGPLTCTKTSATISATVGGFGSSYSYRFNNGTVVTSQTSTTLSLPVTASGTYLLSVTASNGCTTASSTTVTSNTVAPGASINSLTLTCSSPSGVLSVSTATASPAYAWSTGATTPTISVSAAGPYSVTVTNTLNGCSSVASTTVLSDNNVPSVSLNSLTLTCAVTSGVLSATATNTVNPTYQWNTGATTPTISVSASGTYSVTVANANGCRAAASTTVQSNTAAPTVTALVSNTLTCAEPTATISATANPGNSTYAWRGPNSFTSTAQSFTTTIAGAYSVTVTAPNGCTATLASQAAIMVEQNTVPPAQVTANASGTLTCSTKSITVSATSTTPGVTYAWRGPNSFSSSAQSFTTAAEGVYSVTVTGTNGCTTATSTTVTSNTVVPTVTASVSNTLTCTQTTAVVSATATPGNSTYAWSGPNSFTSAAQSFTTSTPGTYTLIITAPNGCTVGTSMGTTVERDSSVPSVSATGGVIGCQQPTFQLTASSTSGNVTYRWTGPNSYSSTSQTPTVSAAGVYTVVATNTLNGCLAADTAIVTQQPCAGLGDLVFIDVNANGIQDAGELGIPNVTVALYQNNNLVRSTITDPDGVYSFTGLIPGIPYQVQFGTPSGYTTTLANIGGDDAKDSDADPVTGRTGSYTLAPGEYNPTVDAGFFQTASLGDKVFADTDRDGIQDNVELGIANVTVRLLDVDKNVLKTTKTDADGVYSFTGLTPGVPYIVEFVGPTGYASTSQNQGSNDALDSDADATTGRTGSYTLASGENNPTVDAGYYCVPPIVTAMGGLINCAKPSLQLQATSSITPATYRWTGPNSFTSNQQNVAVSNPGTYTVVVTSNNGCLATGSDTAVVSQDIVAPQLTASVSNTLTCAQPTATVSATASPGNVTYAWTGPSSFTSTSQSLTTAVSGQYSVTVTTPNGCTATAQVTVDENIDEPEFTLTGGRLTCADPKVVLASSLSPASAYSFLWTGPNSYTSSQDQPTVGAAGTYTLVATSLANGCSGAVSINVEQDTDIPGATALGGTITCANPTVQLSGVTSTTAGVTYAWTGPGINAGNANAQNPTVSVPGVYTLAVTSSKNSCTSIATALVDTDTNAPVVQVNTPAVCAGETLVLTASTTAANGVTYIWTGPNGFTANQAEVRIPNATTATAGSYTLTVTNPVSGCFSKTVVEGIVNPLPANFTLSAQEATCTGANSLSNGQVTISNFGPNDRYSITTSTTYDGATNYANAKSIPVNGVLVSNISRTGTPTTYIVRLYNQTGCFLEKTITLQNELCTCPPPKCVPIVIKKSKSGLTALVR